MQRKKKLTGDVQTSPALRNAAMCAGPVKKGKSIISPPGDLWFRVTFGEAHQGHIGADVHCHI